MTREKIYVRKLKDGSSKWLVATALGGTIARVSSYLAALNLAVALTTESVCAVPECGEAVAESSIRPVASRGPREAPARPSGPPHTGPSTPGSIRPAPRCTGRP